MDDAFVLHSRKCSPPRGGSRIARETVTRFWARIVAHVAEARGTSDVDELVAAFPRLLDPKLPQSHGSAHALERGRGAWVEPDLRALPA